MTDLSLPDPLGIRMTYVIYPDVDAFGARRLDGTLCPCADLIEQHRYYFTKKFRYQIYNKHPDGFIPIGDLHIQPMGHVHAMRFWHWTMSSSLK